MSVATNTFTGGLQMDLHPLSSQNSVLTNALNATLVTVDGDEMILQNDMGNLKIHVTNEDGEELDRYVHLTEGYIPVGVNVYGGIAYIASVNPNDRKCDLYKCEIGTFPSPDYNIQDGKIKDSNPAKSNKIITQYYPLFNIVSKGNNDKVDYDTIYPMNTYYLDFDLEHPVDIQVQPSYDGSVNLILNDNKNIPRLINSRFSVRKNNTWEIPERRKNNDNLYSLYNPTTYQEYVEDNTLYTPTFSPSAGTYYNNIYVSLECKTPGASIYYSINNKNVDQLYTGNILINASSTIYAKAVKYGQSTDVVSSSYTISKDENIPVTDSLFIISVTPEDGSTLSSFRPDLEHSYITIQFNKDVTVSNQSLALRNLDTEEYIQLEASADGNIVKIYTPSLLEKDLSDGKYLLYIPKDYFVDDSGKYKFPEIRLTYNIKNTQLETPKGKFVRINKNDDIEWLVDDNNNIVTLPGKYCPASIQQGHLWTSDEWDSIKNNFKSKVEYSGNPTYDPVTALYGSGYRTPTLNDFTYLIQDSTVNKNKNGDVIVSHTLKGDNSFIVIPPENYLAATIYHRENDQLDLQFCAIAYFGNTDNGYDIGVNDLGTSYKYAHLVPVIRETNGKPVQVDEWVDMGDGLKWRSTDMGIIPVFSNDASLTSKTRDSETYLYGFNINHAGDREYDYVTEYFKSPQYRTPTYDQITKLISNSTITIENNKTVITSNTTGNSITIADNRTYLPYTRKYSDQILLQTSESHATTNGSGTGPRLVWYNSKSYYYETTTGIDEFQIATPLLAVYVGNTDTNTFLAPAEEYTNLNINVFSRPLKTSLGVKYKGKFNVNFVSNIFGSEYQLLSEEDWNALAGSITNQDGKIIIRDKNNSGSICLESTGSYWLSNGKVLTIEDDKYSIQDQQDGENMFLIKKVTDATPSPTYNPKDADIEFVLLNENDTCRWATRSLTYKYGPGCIKQNDVLSDADFELLRTVVGSYTGDKKYDICANIFENAYTPKRDQLKSLFEDHTITIVGENAIISGNTGNKITIPIGLYIASNLNQNTGYFNDYGINSYGEYSTSKVVYNSIYNILPCANANTTPTPILHSSVKLKPKKLVKKAKQLESDCAQEQEDFNVSTSLHKRIKQYPVPEYRGVLNSGSLPVGNYVLYFKYSDADGNETDFVAQSSIISIFKGKDGDPFSIDGGVRDMNSNKTIQIRLTNVDTIYPSIKVYYSRTSADKDENRSISCYKINKTYPIENDVCDILISGSEDKTTIPQSDLEKTYYIVNKSKAQAQCNNMLFLGNFQTHEVQYAQLKNLTLTIKPTVTRVNSKSVIGNISTKDYSDDTSSNDKVFYFNSEYFNTKNIYYNVGYWPNEYYRLGIVYIYNDNTQSSVYNTLGGIIPLNPSQQPTTAVLNGDWKSTTQTHIQGNLNDVGVIKIEEPSASFAEQQLYSLGITIPNTTKNELQKLGITGFFVVRQKRIPTILAQAYTLPWDKESKVPIVEYLGKRLPWNNANKCPDATRQAVPELRYFVESFLKQCGDEHPGDNDSGSEGQMSRVDQDYCSRLHDILRECIDAKMVSIPTTANELEFVTNSDQLYDLKNLLIDCYIKSPKYYYYDQYVEYDTWEVPQNFDVKNNVKAQKLYKIFDYYLNRVFLMGTSGSFKSADKYYRSADRLSVSSANMRHYYDLYKYCTGNELTAICPDFEINQAFYNQLFTGGKFWVMEDSYQPGFLHRDDKNYRYYYAIKDSAEKINRGDGTTAYGDNRTFPKMRQFKIASVTDSAPIIAIDNTIFKSAIGSAQEAFRFSYINEEHCAARFGSKGNSESTKEHNGGDKHDFNLVRGLYSPYLGIVAPDSILSEKQTGWSKVFNIYDDSVQDPYSIAVEKRLLNDGEYYPITDVIPLDKDGSFTVGRLNCTNNSTLTVNNIFRGDCFICTFTHRLNRNFQDPVAPANDTIINPKTWQKHYDPDKDEDELKKINLGDVNAVKLGSWLTIKVRSSRNLSIRSLDESYVTEKALMGLPRGFYPLQQASADGGYKIPNSYVFNDGFSSTVGEKTYAKLPDAPYYSNDWQTKIIYSNKAINSGQGIAYQNGYRVFQQGNEQTYSKEYGQLIKLVSTSDYEEGGGLLAVFEHAVAFIKVDERTLINRTGSSVAVDANQVIPDNLNNILSDSFGSKYADSVVKTPYYIYGVDTDVKKIWRVNIASSAATKIDIISDFKVEQFLKDNIQITEKLQIGLSNIKTHYNENKHDVIFTFYQNSNGKDKKAWSLCYNEIGTTGNSSGIFSTFYSWIPIESFNINGYFYSIDREQVRDYLITQNKDNYYNFIWQHNNPVIRPLPTHWYGKQHPFEFEFIVLDNASQQKIFETLQIISNNAEPESFHYQIVGDSLDFSNDKVNMYYRQEATKYLFRELGSGWTYDEDFQSIVPNQNNKSTLFPLYYNRIDTPNDIYDQYQLMTDDSRQYQNLSGSEIVHNKRDNEFDIQTHIKNTPIDVYWGSHLIDKDELDQIDKKYKRLPIFGQEFQEGKRYYKKVLKPKEAFIDSSDNVWYYLKKYGGRLRGNSQYKDDKWRIQIPSITYMQKNEPDWNVPPVIISQPPKDLKSYNITSKDLPNTYSNGGKLHRDAVYVGNWTYRKESKIRDKYCKIKIRYSGEQLATILTVLTTFNISAT